MLRRSLLLAVLSVAACGPEPGPDQLAFLADGATTRDDVFLRLGRPSFVHDQERILAYRIRLCCERVRLVEEPTPWPVVVGDYSLVLQFDDAAVLRRHRLVALHPEQGS
jgi:hypothetical protein